MTEKNSFRDAVEKLCTACEEGNIENVEKILNTYDSDQTKRRLLLNDFRETTDDLENPMQIALRMLLRYDASKSENRWSLVAAILRLIDDKNIQSELLSTKSKSTNSTTPVSSILKTSLDNRDEEILHLQKAYDHDFGEFEPTESESSENYNHKKNQHPLVILTKSDEGLIKHDYIDKYIRYYWDNRKLWLLVWGSVVAYFIMAFCATYSIVKGIRGRNSTINCDNATTGAMTDDTIPTSSDIATVFCVGVSCIILFLIEVFQFIAKGKSYFTYKSNWLDILITSSVIAVHVSSAARKCYGSSSQPLAVIETAVLCLMWFYGAWKIAIIPHIPPKSYKELYEKQPYSHLPECLRRPWYDVYKFWLQAISKTSVNFMMFFEVLKSVCWYFPVLIYLCVIFTVGFLILNEPRSGEFANFGHTIVTMFVMAMGEINYKARYHDNTDTWLENPWISIASYILLLLFFATLSITGMNLLIAKAMCDVERIVKQSEIMLLKNQIDQILEYQQIRLSIQKIRGLCSSSCCDKSSIEKKNSTDVKKHTFLHMS